MGTSEHSLHPSRVPAAVSLLLSSSSSLLLLLVYSSCIPRSDCELWWLACARLQDLSLSHSPPHSTYYYNNPPRSTPLFLLLLMLLLLLLLNHSTTLRLLSLFLCSRLPAYPTRAKPHKSGSCTINVVVGDQGNDEAESYPFICVHNMRVSWLAGCG